MLEAQFRDNSLCQKKELKESYFHCIKFTVGTWLKFSKDFIQRKNDKRFDTIANDKFHNKCFDKNWKPSTSCTNFRTKINAPCFLFHVPNYSSLLYLVHAITRTNASTRATSLMSVKNSTHFCLKHLVPGTLKLKKWKNKNVKLKLSFFFNFC